jgi:hypothetical protein
MTPAPLSVTVEHLADEHADLGIVAILRHTGSRLRVAYRPEAITRAELDTALAMHVDGYAAHLAAHQGRPGVDR